MAAVLTYTELTTEIKNALVANPSTDAPLSSTELQNAINGAYQMVWETSGGRVKNVDSPTGWSGAQSTTGGIVTGLLTDVEEIETLWASTIALSISCTTASSTTVTSSAAFGSVEAGMSISGSGITAGTTVVSVESTSSLTISVAASNSTTTSRTFYSRGSASGDVVVDTAPYTRILWLRQASGMPTYTVPKCYAVVRKQTATESDKNKLELHYWPSVTGFYFPMTYVPQFTPMDGTGGNIPEVNDIEAYDIAWLASLMLAPGLGRQELMAGIAARISNATAKANERRIRAMVEGKQGAT